MSTERDRGEWEAATVSDVVAALVLLALLAPFVRGTASAVASGRDAALFAGAVVLGIVAADFITGFLHWLCDTYFAEDTPIVGPAIIEPFREHHRDPRAMTRRAFLRLSNSNVIATSIVLAGIWGWRATHPGPPSLLADVWITSLAAALWLTNQFHKWAHVAQVPRSVAWLQAAGLILNPVRHARHHLSHDGRAFCVTTGWLNPLLDRVGVFRGMERAIRAVGRAGRIVYWG